MLFPPDDQIIGHGPLIKAFSSLLAGRPNVAVSPQFYAGQRLAFSLTIRAARCLITFFFLTHSMRFILADLGGPCVMMGKLKTLIFTDLHLSGVHWDACVCLGGTSVLD